MNKRESERVNERENEKRVIVTNQIDMQLKSEWEYCFSLWGKEDIPPCAGTPSK